jgi:chromosome segregation ATPase
MTGRIVAVQGGKSRNPGADGMDRAVHWGKISEMRWLLFAATLLLGACASRQSLNLLEREHLLFKAENERIRAEDLEARYRTQKRKADALSDEVFALGQERDSLYARYDGLRSDMAEKREAVTVFEREHAALGKALEEVRAEVARLKAELEKVRTESEALERELEEARARQRALKESGSDSGQQ